MPFTEVDIRALDPRRFRDVLADGWEEVAEAIVEAQAILAGRAVWNINSTPRGGGVAELLRSLLAYARGAGVDARWIAIDGGPEFFDITKRLHNRLHGHGGDAGELGEPERAAYEATLKQVGSDVAEMVRPGDIVFIHDPQPAGMLEVIQAEGIPVVWRCHVGVDQPNEIARSAWEFLRPYVEPADAFVFSRPAYVWEWIDPERVSIIQPSIDAFSPKNQDLTEAQTDAIVRAVGLFDGGPDGAATFIREDGTPSRVNRPAEMIQDDFVPDRSPLVTQVSRWDALKDPVGVVRLYGDHLGGRDAHLVLAGPAPGTVSDDPEALAVLDSTWAARDELEPALRERIHLAVLPMEDPEENAAVVNALQRRSTVVVQKSLAEGFGLTVAEAMWKGRPVVASAIGGIQDQIVDGETGLLVADPTDGRAFGDAVAALLADPGRAGAMGAAGRERVRGQFLGAAHMVRYLELIKTLI
jgi:trehalose synthase